MSTFEYLAIAFTLVLSFAALRVIAGLPAALEPGRRYWVHLTFTMITLTSIVLMFWGFLSFREAVWSLPRFVLVLAGPSLLFFNACTLIPDDPSAVASWRDHFYSVRRRFWVAVLCFGLTTTVAPTWMLGLAWDHPSRFIHGLTIVAGVVGALFPSERAQSILAIGMWIAVLIVPLAVASQPGFLAQ